MEEWEYYATVDKTKEPEIEKLVEEEIFLNKFYAETAKRILAVHDHFQINSDTIFYNIKNWVKKIETGNLENEKICTDEI